MSSLKTAVVQHLRALFGNERVHITFGYETKYKRIRVLDLPKSHTNDAVAIACEIGEAVKPLETVYQIRCLPRGQHQRFNGPGSSHKCWAPRTVQGFKLYELVQAKGQVGYIAGRREKGVFAPTEAGTPQGGTIGPLLANVALQGMEEAILSQRNRKHVEQPILIRYADDFVVLHSDLEKLKEAEQKLVTWLAEIGLFMNQKKTRITHTLTPYEGKVGFDLLGFTVRQFPVGKTHSGKNTYGNPLGYKTLIKPSKEAIKRHLLALNHRMKQLRSVPQWKLIEEAERLRDKAQKLPSSMTNDPDYRRLNYVRYADDFILGFIGPRKEAEAIKQQLRAFLREQLKLELSEEKTLITHARSEAARFLGYAITTLHNDAKRTKRKTNGIGQATKCRSVNRQIGLQVPQDVIEAKCERNKQGKETIHRAELLDRSDYELVMTYQLKYRGIVNYSRLAYNVHRFRELRRVMETSLTKTLASKRKVSVPKVYDKYGTTLKVQDMEATLEERPPRIYVNRTELVQRLLADFCELCGNEKAGSPGFSSKRTRWPRKQQPRCNHIGALSRKAHGGSA